MPSYYWVILSKRNCRSVAYRTMLLNPNDLINWARHLGFGIDLEYLGPVEKEG